MAKATVLSTALMPEFLTVRIERDLTRISSAIDAMTSTIANLTTDVAQRQAQVNQAVIDLDNARAALQTAVDDEEPREVIVQLQEQVIVATSNLVNAKTDLSVATYKLASAEKRKLVLQAEFSENTEENIRTADSGTSIITNDVIGVAEIARQASRGSTFVALPSERPDHSVIYEPARDGKILPKMAERPYGWWYNEMVEPSAQIWQPRYWTAILTFKDDEVNEGTIATIASTNFNTRPDSSILFGNVPFEYETTNSLTFQVGDTVLVEFDSNRSPTIIGFANTGEKPEVFGIARYDYIGSLASRNVVALAFVQFQGATPSPTQNEEISSTGMKGTEAEALGLALDAVKRGHPGKEFTQSTTGITDTKRYKTQLSEFNPTFMNTFVERLIVTNGKSLGGIVVGITGSADGDFVEARGFSRDRNTGAPVTITFDEFGVSNAENASQSLSGITSLIGSAAGSFNMAQSGQQAQQFDSTTTYTKLNALKDWTFTLGGIDMPADYLFDDSNYVTPPEDNQYLTLTRITKTVLSTSSLFGSISFWTSFGPPSDDYVCNPIATNGTQNLLNWSERRDSSLSDQQKTPDTVLEEGALKAPDCVDDGAGIVKAGSTLGTQFFFSNRTINLVDAQDYVFSAFVRRDSYPFIQFGVEGEAETKFDIKAGVEDVSERTVGVNNAGIIAHDGDWWRVWVTFTNSGTNTEKLKLFLLDRPQLSSAGIEYTNFFASNGLNGVALWGMQVTEGVTPQTYVKTTGTAIP